MKRKIFCAVLLVSALCLASCGQKQSATTEQEGTPTVAEPTQEATETPEVTEVPETTEQEPTPEVDPGTGEGAPNPDDTVDLDGAEFYNTGDTIKLESGDASYELVIDKVEYTEERNEHVAEQPIHVMRITYTYTNISGGTLLIDDMRFRLMDESQTTSYELYYLGTEGSAEPIDAGGNCSAQICYAVPSENEKYVLAYEDTINTDVKPVAILLD